jgi:hypothetical protein
MTWRTILLVLVALLAIERNYSHPTFGNGLGALLAAARVGARLW